MFSAQVWGSVADMIGAVSTGGAAVSALAYYILDSRKSQAAQARLVRASLHPDQDGVLEVSVTNDSDRPITLEQIVYREKNFKQAALKGMPMQTTVTSESGHRWNYERELMRGDSEGVHFIAERKEEILGFRHGGGRAYLHAHLGDQNCRLLPGASSRFVASYSLYRISTNYGLIFFDANGIAWELELLTKKHGPGKLRRARRRGPFKQLDTRSRRGMRPIGYLRTAKRKLRNSIRLRWWLFRHRKEQTTAYPPLTAEAWNELMDKRSSRLEREKAPDQDGTSPTR